MCEVKDFEVKKFDIEKLIYKKNPTILIMGKRGSGKTTLVKDIIHKNIHKYINNDNIIFASTGRGDNFGEYKIDNIMKNNIIQTEYNEDILKEYLNKKMIDIKENIRENTYVIFDDVIYSNKVVKTDKFLQDLQLNNRHYLITSIFTQQYPIKFPIEFQMNFDYIILVGDDFISNLRKIYDYYAGIFPSFDSFRQIHRELTEDHRCMIIDNTIRSGDIRDIISWYKVDIL